MCFGDHQGSVEKQQHILPRHAKEGEKSYIHAAITETKARQVGGKGENARGTPKGEERMEKNAAAGDRWRK